MAKVIRKAPDFVSRLIEALERELNSVGIAAEMSWEPVPPTKLARITVISPDFRNMKPSERQQVVWRIADQALSNEEKMRVSMILTLTPKEIAA
jgi:hypothetical protein